jgi:exodeoxyribonuclease V alpha subunit
MSVLTENSWWDAGIEDGWIGVYEKEMISYLEQRHGKLPDDVICSITFLSLFLKAGHTVLPMDISPLEWGSVIGLNHAELNGLETLKIDKNTLENCPLIGKPGEIKPFILSQKSLSFRKSLNQENKLLQWFINNSKKNNSADISEYITQIFPKSGQNDKDWQRVAAILSIIKPFLIISGGPGTGKTTTVARIIALHQMISAKPLKIALAAPTGKAASRMGEALQTQLKEIDIPDDIKSKFPSEAKTVHRLLSGVREKGLLPPAEKKYLNQDVIIIDEASMIDLNLMYRLVNHLSPETTLILLGDKDQLASVEAGSVFSDLCQKQENVFSGDTLSLLNNFGERNIPASDKIDDISNSIVYLTKSYRFDQDSGIGKLAEAIKTGEASSESYHRILNQFTDVAHHAFDYRKEKIEYMIEEVLARIKSAQKISSPEKMMIHWKKSVWLSVLRRGLAGSERLNRLVEQQMAAKRVVESNRGWYHGRMVIITQNDYNLGVFNGDLGVCIREEDGSFAVHIESGSTMKKVKPNRLTNAEPAYFLTVHKSQGSEFDHVNFLLPPSFNPILSRELIYTAVTRAKYRVSIYGSEELLMKGIRNKTVRYTGLQALLKNGSLTDI